MEKERLIQQIDDLKIDIQALLDKKRTLKNAEEIEKCEEDKEKKIKILRDINNKLLKMYKKEKEDMRLKNEIKRIGKTIDTMEFQGAKSNKERQATAKEAKKNRDILKQEYLEYMKKEELYLQNDPSDMPGYIFLEQDILDRYGLCPYIEINFENKEEMIRRRKEWLELQEDKGDRYYNLVNNLINKQELDKLIMEKDKVEEVLKDDILQNMSETQMVLYEKSIEYINEFTESVIKTKKLKEKMKVVINNLSILNAELKIPIHNYFSIKYNIPVMVNEIETDENKEGSKHIEFYRLEVFLENLEKYKNMIELISQKMRYNTNIIKNLKNELYLYLTKQKNFVNMNKKIIVQSGKYFKRWILLTEDEKMERFNSFCNYYVEKYMIQEGILSENLKQETVDKLENMIKDAFTCKKMVYRDYVWNANKGILERIKILKYDREKREFFLKFTKVNNQENNKQKDKKKSSKRTIFIKHNEKVINEEILYFIVKKLQKQESEGTKEKEEKEKCLEAVKSKLCIKKVSSEDKELVYKKYDEMYEVINNNKNNDIKIQSILN